MKRIVQCPKCQAKLSVFDMGKPITQKCPKCGDTFTIESEANKGASDDKAAPAEVKKEEVKAEPKAEPKTEVKSDAKADVKEEKKEDKKDETKDGAKDEKKADKKDEAKPDSKTTSTDEKKEDKKVESKADAKDEKKADKKDEAKADVKADAKKTDGKDKEPAKKSSLAKVAAAAQTKPTVTDLAAQQMPGPECGISFFDVVAIIGLLVVILIVQVIGLKRTSTRLSQIEQQCQTIQSELNAIRK